MDLVAHTTSAVATIALVNGGDPGALDVWFTDRMTGQTLVGHVSVQNESGDRASVVLAVKAVDFLRARMFDFLVARPTSLADETSRPASTLVSPVLDVASPPARRSSRFGFSIGIDALQSFQGLGTMVLPMLRGTYDSAAWSSFRLTIAGLGTRSNVNVMGGGAIVSEELAMAWAVMPGRARGRPLLFIGAGVHEIRAQGTAVAPYTARAASQVSLAVGLSAGLRGILNRHLALSAEAGSFLLFPEPQVSIAGLEGGRTGRPGLFATVTLEARF